jgi:hypothetical protein
MPGMGVAIPAEEEDDDILNADELFLPKEIDLSLGNGLKRIDTYLAEKANVRVLNRDERAGVKTCPFLCAEHRYQLNKLSEVNKVDNISFTLKEDSRLRTILKSAQYDSFCSNVHKNIGSRLYRKHLGQDQDRMAQFPFVPHYGNLAYFLHQIEKIRGKKVKSFLDLGSGFGNKVYEAVRYGVKIAHGVEINREYLTKARELVPEGRFFCSDILSWKPKRRYDVVYLYEPLADQRLKLKLIENVKRQFPVGQFVVWVQATGFDVKRHGFERAMKVEGWHIGASIYRIGADKQ